MSGEMQLRLQASEGPSLYFHVARDGQPMVVRVDTRKQNALDLGLTSREIALLRALLEHSLAEMNTPNV